MQYFYGQQMPLRILDEIDFWKQQEAEHTVVIRELVTGLEDKYVAALVKWEQALSETHMTSVKFLESVVRSGYYISPQLYQEILQFVAYCLKQSEEFIKLCTRIKTKSEAVRKNPTAKVVLDHIMRESEYFVGIAQVLLYGTHTTGNTFYQKRSAEAKDINNDEKD